MDKALITEYINATDAFIALLDQGLAVYGVAPSNCPNTAQLVCAGSRYRAAKQAVQEELG